MSAAQHADVLFVKNKEGNDLADYCKDKGYPFKACRPSSFIYDLS